MYIRVNGRDNVAIVVSPEGVSPDDALPVGLTAHEIIPQGHKIALTDFARGENAEEPDDTQGSPASRHMPAYTHLAA